MARATLHYFGDITAICPDLHDLCVSKCVAHREKDAEFVRLLLQEGHISIEALTDRIRQLDDAKYPVEAIVTWAKIRAREARDSRS
jgi:hypothetical protein